MNFHRGATHLPIKRGEGERETEKESELINLELERIVYESNEICNNGLVM